MQIFNLLKKQIFYKKYRNCNIPCPLPRKDNLLWIKKNNNEYVIANNLLDVFETNLKYEFIYHFKAKMNGRKTPSQPLKYQYIISHRHTFEDIIKELYNYPQTFKIPKKYLDEYSTQELNYLKLLKNYLCLIDLKDTNNYKDNMNRYYNEKALEYSTYQPLWINNNKLAKNIINGKKNYLIYVYNSKISYLNQKYFIIDKNYNYLGIVKATEEKIIKFKELQKDMVNPEILEFKSFKAYQKDLFEALKNKAKLYDKEFTQESLICYVTIKILKIF